MRSYLHPLLNHLLAFSFTLEAQVNVGDGNIERHIITNTVEVQIMNRPKREGALVPFVHRLFALVTRIINCHS